MRTLRSSGTERGIGDIISRFGEGQMSQIGQTIEGARGRAAGLIPQTGAMEGLDKGVPQMKAAFEYGALPRQIEQIEIMGQIEEFKRTTPELNPILDKMMSYLGLSPNAAYTSSDPLLQLVSSFIGGAGEAAGMAMAA